MTAELSAAITPVDVAVAAAEHIRQLTGGASRVAVYELDASHRGLAMLTHQRRQRGAAAAVGQSAAVRAARGRTGGPGGPRHLDGGRDGGRRAPARRELPDELVESISAFGLAATISLPLAVAGRTVGVIGIAYPEVQRFSATERAMLLAVAEQCAQALDRARLFRVRARHRRDAPAQPAARGAAGACARLALAAHYVPGAEGAQAGGDWYDVVELEGGRVAIAVGDVVGQGPAAAAVMGQLRSALSRRCCRAAGRPRRWNCSTGSPRACPVRWPRPQPAC